MVTFSPNKSIYERCLLFSGINLNLNLSMIQLRYHFYYTDTFRFHVLLFRGQHLGHLMTSMRNRLKYDTFLRIKKKTLTIHAVS